MSIENPSGASPPTAASQLGCRSRSIDAHLTSSLRGRFLAAGLYPLEDHFAAKGTSAPVVVGQADKEPLLVVVRAWVDEVGQEPAVALGGLLGLRDARRADLAGTRPPSRPRKLLERAAGRHKIVRVD
jgi:hypothetical protein